MRQPWLAGYTNAFPMANLGFMTMLRGLQEWLHPKHPKLQAVCLISKATMAVLYTTYTVGPQLEELPWKLIRHMPVNEAHELFFRLFISVAGNPYNDGTIMTTPPAFEYNVTQEDVRISQCGKKLLVKVYMEEEWHRVPAWHPYFKLPGSPWNNYIKNTEQPTFLSTPVSTAIKYELPSSALAIALEFRTKYFAVRDVYEEVRVSYGCTWIIANFIPRTVWSASLMRSETAKCVGYLESRDVSMLAKAQVTL
jgi:hypothetical protein